LRIKEQGKRITLNEHDDDEVLLLALIKLLIVDLTIRTANINELLGQVI